MGGEKKEDRYKDGSALERLELQLKLLLQDLTALPRQRHKHWGQAKKLLCWGSVKCFDLKGLVF